MDQDKNTHSGWGKFQKADADYFAYLENLMDTNPSPTDLLHQFPAYVGSVNLGRYLFFYDLYKKVMELNGHLADVGVYRGASMLFLAKLVKLFEPYSTTQVHGFDWFKGMLETSSVKKGEGTAYVSDYQTLMNLIQMQSLEDIAILHRLDLVTESEAFFQANPHLRFKLIFIDCGQPKALASSLAHFWPRLVQGGILVMDHYNVEVSPAESDLVERTVSGNLIKQMPFNRQPTAYIVKETRLAGS